MRAPRPTRRRRDRITSQEWAAAGLLLLCASTCVGCQSGIWKTAGDTAGKAGFVGGLAALPGASEAGLEWMAFALAARDKVTRQFVILEHIGNDFVIAAGSFLGRIVALGRNHANVQQGLLQGKKCWKQP